MSAKLPPTDDNNNNEEGKIGSTEQNSPPLNKGFWSKEEEAYVAALMAEFRAGRLPLAEGTTLRSFLAKMLHCHPKRVSKKFRGTDYNGKLAYERKPSNMTIEQLKARQQELQELEQKFRAVAIPATSTQPPAPASTATATSSHTALSMNPSLAAAGLPGGVSSLGIQSSDLRNSFLFPGAGQGDGLGGSSLSGLNYPPMDQSRLSQLNNIYALNQMPLGLGSLTPGSPPGGYLGDLLMQHQQQRQALLMNAASQQQRLGTAASTGNPIFPTTTRGASTAEQADRALFLSNQLLGNQLRQNQHSGTGTAGMGQHTMDHSTILNRQQQGGTTARPLVDFSRRGGDPAGENFRQTQLDPKESDTETPRGPVQQESKSVDSPPQQESKSVDSPPVNVAAVAKATTRRPQPVQESDHHDEPQKKKARKN